MRAEHRVDFLSCPFVVVIETSICHYSPHTHLFVLLTCQHKSFNYMLSLATELNKQPRQGWLIAQGLAVEAGRRRPFCFVPRIPILSAKSLVKCSTCDLQYGLHMRGAAQSLRGSHQLPPMPRTRKPISKISFLGLASLALLFSQRSIRPGCFHCAPPLCHCNGHISFALPCLASGLHLPSWTLTAPRPKSYPFKTWMPSWKLETQRRAHSSTSHSTCSPKMTPLFLGSFPKLETKPACRTSVARWSLFPTTTSSPACPPAPSCPLPRRLTTGMNASSSVPKCPCTNSLPTKNQAMRTAFWRAFS